jgi:hypothetical protein
MAYRGGGSVLAGGRGGSSQITMIKNVSPVGGGPATIPFTMSCTTATIDSQMWVTESVLYTQSYGSPYTYGYTSVIDAEQNFRAYDDGRMTNFKEILQDTGLSLPGTNSSVVWASNGAGVTVPFGGLKVKRPNCVCTSLSKFIMHKRSSWGGAEFKKITLEDGYEPVYLGKSLMVLSSREAPDHTGSIPSFRTVDELEPGDFILTCTNTENTMKTGTDCVKVAATASYTPSGTKYYVSGLTTAWPKNEWSNSTVNGIMMLENGMYIATNPANGSMGW